MKKVLLFIMFIFLLGCSDADKKTEDESYSITLEKHPIKYEQDGKSFEGYMVENPAIQGKRPGVLVIHPWAGIDDFTKKEADKYAKDGYIVFAMDMFGTDVNITSNKEASEISGAYREDRNLMRHRIDKALEVLKSRNDVDEHNIGVIGYCFGGDSAIDYMLYREVFAVGVSIHGFYKSPLIENHLNGSLELHHGEDDELSTLDDLSEFEAIHPDVEVFIYAGAKHAFTVDTSPNYNKNYADLVVERTRIFLKRKFDTVRENNIFSGSIVIDKPMETVYDLINNKEKKFSHPRLQNEVLLFQDSLIGNGFRYVKKVKAFNIDDKSFTTLDGFDNNSNSNNEEKIDYSKERFTTNTDYLLEDLEQTTRVTLNAYSIKSNHLVDFFQKKIFQEQLKNLKSDLEK